MPMAGLHCWRSISKGCRSAGINANRYRRARHADDTSSRPFYLQSPTASNPPMELSKKVKTALDETRMLILGAQILLGFELRSAFSEGFDKLSGHSRHLE